MLNRFLIFVLIFSFSCNSLAENSSLKSAQEIYYETLSPFCPGRSLADCPTEQSKDLKARILQDLESGKSKQEVLSKVLSDYGQHLSAKPSLSGFNLFAWIIPISVIIIGFVVVVIRVFSLSKIRQEQDT